MLRKDDRKIYNASALDAIPWLEHGFGTRDAAPSFGERAVVTLRQVHSDVAVIVRGPDQEGVQGDALITDTAGLLVGVRTADCLPILLVETRRRAVAAVHAGWRGTVANIAGKTVARLAEELGGDPRSMHAVVGPGIGVCCYEVGPEVAARFRRLFPEREDLDRRTRVDLAEANRRQLAGAGLPVDQIHIGAPCSFCHPEEFHSYRRDGSGAGRMLSAVGIRS